LERERERDRIVIFKNVSDRDLVQFDRFRPFTVPERFMSVYERFRSFFTFLRRSTGIRIINLNAKKRHETIENVQER
jgi:hypothetical protein